MKRKLLTLLLACALVFSNTAVAFAEGTDAGQDTTGETLEVRYESIKDKVGEAVSGSTAVAAVGSEEVVILDVRAAAKYEAGHLRGSLHVPVFTDNGPVTYATDELSVAFIKTVTDKKATLEGKDLYILCNSGARGARAAAVLLGDAGYDLSKVHTITGGAGDADVTAALFSLPVIETYNTVTGSDAVGADSSKVFIIDVRTSANHEKGHLDNSVNWPLFNANGVTNCEDALADAFLANVEANAASLSDKDIYILCNSGARGAQAATKLLVSAGYSNDDIFTIVNGAKGLEVRYAFIKAQVGAAVTGAEAVAAVDNDNVVIIDVRTAENYNAGHLRGSLHMPVFTANGPVETADADLAVEFIETAKAKASVLEGKDLYLLCNSGARGARAATVLLSDAGYDLSKVHTITGGAKDTDVAAAWFTLPTIEAYNTVTGSDAVNADSANVFIIDVRTPANYEKGHLDNSVNWPLFDANGVTNCEDALADAFLDNVVANKAALTDKDIYILCNSGARGAQAATKLLVSAGYSNDDVFTIVNGAKGIEVRYAFIKDQVGAPVTSAEALEAYASTSETAPVIIDVRATGTYGAGHLKGVKNVPVFTSNGAVQTVDDELAKAFVEYFTANKDALEGRDIYLLCNSGQSGARAATVLLKDAGYDLSKVHTITGGYNKNEDIKAAAIYVSDTRAINATLEDDKLIIDVRSSVNYELGHLDDSLSLPVFDESNGLDSEEAAALAEAFVAYVEENMDEFEGKTIYLLCNSGNRGALKAIDLLAEAGITENVFIIEGGATSTLIQEAFSKDVEEILPEDEPTYDDEADDETADSEDNNSQSSTPKTGDSAPVMTYVLVMFAALAAILVSKKKLTK